MKAFVVCAAALLASAVQAEVSSSLAHAALHAKWSSFKAQHNKEYHPSEESLRMAIYVDNTRLIEEHNTRYHQGLESYKLGHNDMSDLTVEEVQTTRMGAMASPDGFEMHPNASIHMPSGLALPRSVDWRKNGCVQKVKNQGTCGSCYVFAGVGAVETAHCIKHRQLLDLSEQHVVDCGGRGCNGGFETSAFEYLMKCGGAHPQNAYPYTGRPSTCGSLYSAPIAKVTSYRTIRQFDENALAEAVATAGALYISYNPPRDHHLYEEGIIDTTACQKQGGHAVLLVGYGTENGKDYWLIKNSWGTRWGENGFFRMARGKNMCGIPFRAAYPIVA